MSEREGEAPPASPCTRVCRLDERGLCVGCRRTLEEIAQWSSLDAGGRREVLRQLPARS